jgi:hypothetical protein
MALQQAAPAKGTPYIDAGLNLNSGNVILDGSSPPVPARVSISAAAGGSNISLVTFQVQDNAGNNLGGVFPLVLWLSDTAGNGGGLTATTASGTVGAGASGTDLSALTAKKALLSLTDATGKYILSITDTVKTGFVPCATIPGLAGRSAIGTALTSANYG